jgi:predicted transcriptional regulator
VPADNARRQHVRDLVERLFGGQSEALVVGLIDDEPMSRAELERLRALIDERLDETAGAAARPPAAERAGEKGGARGR